MKGPHSFAIPLFAAVVANLRQVRYEWPLMKKKCGSASENNSGGGFEGRKKCSIGRLFLGLNLTAHHQ